MYGYKYSYLYTNTNLGLIYNTIGYTFKSRHRSFILYATIYFGCKLIYHAHTRYEIQTTLVLFLNVLGRVLTYFTRVCSISGIRYALQQTSTYLLVLAAKKTCYCNILEII